LRELRGNSGAYSSNSGDRGLIFGTGSDTGGSYYDDFFDGKMW
jgi:hypothetical protein